LLYADVVHVQNHERGARDLNIPVTLTVHGLNIFGLPIPQFYNGAFGIADPMKRAAVSAAIPSDTYILVTHVPPYGILDGRPGISEHFGCPELLKAVQRINHSYICSGMFTGERRLANSRYDVYQRVTAPTGRRYRAQARAD
jgi:hypothetical protein